MEIFSNSCASPFGYQITERKDLQGTGISAEISSWEKKKAGASQRRDLPPMKRFHKDLTSCRTTRIGTSRGPWWEGTHSYQDCFIILPLAFCLRLKLRQGSQRWTWGWLDLFAPLLSVNGSFVTWHHCHLSVSSPIEDQWLKWLSGAASPNHIRNRSFSNTKGR